MRFVPLFCLLLRHSQGGVWIPAVLAFFVLLGTIFSLWLLVSGIRGLIVSSMGRANRSRKRSVRRSALKHPMLRLHEGADAEHHRAKVS